MAGVIFDGATRIYAKDGKPAVDSLMLSITLKNSAKYCSTGARFISSRHKK